jgi:hypothetical protein
VVYTVLYGKRNRLLEQPVRRDSALDFIAFVDDDTVRSDTWTLRKRPPIIPTDLERSSRFPKICAHRFLPEYEASLYIDTKVRLKQRPEAIFDALLQDDDTIACILHDERTEIFAEAEAVIYNGFDRADICKAQLDAYRRDGYTSGAPLVWSGMLLRRHNDPRLQDSMERWFAQVLRYSRRDQLSFSYVAEKTGLKPRTHAIPNRISPWHEWPIETEADRIGYRESAFESVEGDALDLAAAQMQISQLRRDIAALKESTSWRVTAPLRSARRLLTLGSPTRTRLR